MRALLLVSLFATPAYADYTGNQALSLEAGGNVGFHFIGLRGNAGRNSFLADARFGLRIAQPVALEIGLTFVPNGLTGFPAQLVLNPHFDVVYDFLQDRIRPYLGGGMGAILFLTSEAGEYAPIYEGHVEAGLKIGLVDRMALRIEAKLLAHPQILSQSNAWPSFVSGMFTIGLMWGSAGREAVETPATVKATKTAVASIDSDGDGVNDDEDDCPSVKGSQANGCPMLSVQVDKVFLGAHARFEKGEAKIGPEYATALDQLAAYLKEHQEIKKLGVHGHSGIEGNKAQNQALSEARAKAVVDYLVGKGVEPGRLEAKGFGQERPIDSNKSVIGKDRNRRVEFVILQKS